MFPWFSTLVHISPRFFRVSHQLAYATHSLQNRRRRWSPLTEGSRNKRGLLWTSMKNIMDIFSVWSSEWSQYSLWVSITQNISFWFLFRSSRLNFQFSTSVNTLSSWRNKTLSTHRCTEQWATVTFSASILLEMLISVYHIHLNWLNSFLRWIAKLQRINLIKVGT